MTPQQFKEAREGLGLTQVELADRIGIDPRTVQRFEREDGPGPSDLAAYAITVAVKLAAVEDALENLLGVIDTPIGRRKISSDFSKEAIQIARAAMAKARGEG